MLENLRQIWPKPTQPRPIVIIGAGGIVHDAHLPTYKSEGLKVAGIADVNLERCNALMNKFGIKRGFSSPEAAVAHFGNDVIYDIAVPPHAIVSILKCLPDEASVLIQKPMGSDLSKAKHIRQICRDKNLKAAINFQLRYSPMMLAAEEAIRSGMIGELLEIDLHVNIFTPWSLFPFLIPMERVEMLVHSIHYFDTIRAIAGDPQSVFARSLRDPRAGDFAQTRTSAILDYGDRMRGIVSINHNHQNGRKFQDAWFRFEGTQGAIMTKLGVDYNYPHGEPDEFWICKNGSDWHSLDLKGNWFIEAFAGPMSNLQRYSAGEDNFLYTDIEDGFKTMALIEALFEACALEGVKMKTE